LVNLLILDYNYKLKVLVTGIAGFIGFHVAKRLLDEGYSVVGFDNINDYYDVQLKLDRLKELGIEENDNQWISNKINLKFVKADLLEKDTLLDLFRVEKFDYVVHLAAQAGVRYSLEAPQKYIDSNITGFLNILECCRNYPVKHLVFASSSSLYGLNAKIPFSTEDRTDRPISLYAASKKANELMAHTYSHLFKIPITGLRFFTVYGPWGRPDMAMHLFTEAILKEKPIKVFNSGNMSRDFTYVDDIVESIKRLIIKAPEDEQLLMNLFNIGNNKPEKLIDFIEEVESATQKTSIKEYLPMQPGDVEQTYADVQSLFEFIDYKPQTLIHEGISSFVNWYKEYYNSPL
jgi:UDP-glucuronate 4-epimerase